MAAANAVAKAGEDLRNMSWFEVVEQRGSIADGKDSAVSGDDPSRLPR